MANDITNRAKRIFNDALCSYSNLFKVKKTEVSLFIKTDKGGNMVYKLLNNYKPVADLSYVEIANNLKNTLSRQFALGMAQLADGVFKNYLEKLALKYNIEQKTAGLMIVRKSEDMEFDLKTENLFLILYDNGKQVETKEPITFLMIELL